MNGTKKRGKRQTERNHGNLRSPSLRGMYSLDKNNWDVGFTFSSLPVLLASHQLCISVTLKTDISMCVVWKVMTITLMTMVMMVILKRLYTMGTVIACFLVYLRTGKSKWMSL